MRARLRDPITYLVLVGGIVAMFGIARVVFDRRRDAQIAAEQANIELITSAMNTYKADFGFPPVYTDGAIPVDARPDGR